MENFGATDTIPIQDHVGSFQPTLKRTRKKGPSGHVAAGRKWETSEKGRIWKAQTVRAKHELHDIIKKRTGLDVFANQRMTLKYAGLKRDGKSTEVKRIIEKVIANAKEGAKSPKRGASKRHANREPKRFLAERPKENSAEIPANNRFQPIQPIQPIQQTLPPKPRIQPSFQNPAENTFQQIQPLHNSVETDRIDLPDFLD